MKLKPQPALNSLSVGFYAKRFSIHPKGSAVRRTLQAVHLAEVSLVTDPSNAAARITDVKRLSNGDSQKLSPDAADTRRRTGPMSPGSSDAITRALTRLTVATVALAHCLQGLARCTITRLVLMGQACRAPQIQ